MAYIQPSARYRITWADAFSRPEDARSKAWANARHVVYVVRCDEMPVYIGQTNQGIMRRLRQHQHKDSWLSLLHNKWKGAKWEIEIWEYARPHHAERAEMHLILLYRPQCNLHKTGKDMRHGGHPCEYPGVLAQMYKSRGFFIRRYWRAWRSEFKNGDIFDLYLDLPPLPDTEECRRFAYELDIYIHGDDIVPFPGDAHPLKAIWPLDWPEVDRPCSIDAI